jgi:hypothetical protein
MSPVLRCRELPLAESVPGGCLRGRRPERSSAPPLSRQGFGKVTQLAALAQATGAAPCRGGGDTDRGRGRVGWDPLHGSGGSQVAELATLPEPCQGRAGRGSGEGAAQPHGHRRLPGTGCRPNSTRDPDVANDSFGTPTWRSRPGSGPPRLPPPDSNVLNESFRSSEVLNDSFKTFAGAPENPGHRGHRWIRTAPRRTDGRAGRGRRRSAPSPRRKAPSRSAGRGPGRWSSRRSPRSASGC